MKWFVFYSQINAESQVRDAISELGFATFVPFEKRIKRFPNRKPRIYSRALFPRYGFVQFDADDASWAYILETKGLMAILCSQGKPAPVADRIIDGLKLADSIGVFDRTKPPSIGAIVEITAGPFSGMLGRIIKARTGDRMKVMLKMLNAEVAATVPLMAMKELNV